MSGVAIAGAALVGAGASIYSSRKQAKAQRSAAEQQARAAAFDQHARVGGACQGKIHALCSLRRNDGKAGSEMTTALPPERK